MSKKSELKKGDKYGRLEVVEETEPRISKRFTRMVICKCQCGSIIKTSLNSLKMGHTRSCGCILQEQKHGHSRVGGKNKQSKLYMVWSAMKSRCKNTKNKDFKDYGGRGIKVCDRWLRSFNNFLEDMGEPEPGRSLDRIDNNGNYCKENCRWATSYEQNNNSRGVKKIEHKGETLSQSDWARKLGGSMTLITDRIRNGATPEEAVSRPLRKIKKYKHERK